MTRLRSDFVFGSIDTALSASATTLSSPALARLPVVAGSDYATLTLTDRVAGTYEIVHVTAHGAGATTATIQRACEGSSAVSWISGSSWLHGPTAQDFAVGTRGTATITTASLAAGAVENGTVAIAPGYRLLAIATNVAARVRLYTTSAARTADANRAVGATPAAGSGLVLEYVTTSGALSGNLNPLVDGASPVPDTSTVYYAVTNTAGTQPVTVTLTYVRTE